MALFFDAAWFDARLAEKNLDRGALAASAGLERSELHRLFIHERAPTAAELNAFAALLDADIVEISLRCGVANPDAPPVEDSGQRIESMEARLDEIDAWLESLEAESLKKSA
ncbi:MAG TPA: DNA-binding protein [Terricaulis sp.]|nr:DNA-binding protein [Terricaulis sp.]